MNNLQKTLFGLCDKEYALFQAKLTPTVPLERFIGVRVPVLKEFARNFAKSEEKDSFLADIPHYYYDENMLHSVLLSMEKDYEKAISYVEAFLPYVDNWAVCDTLKPKAFSKNKDKLIVKIREWVSSGKPYTIRFGIEMLMNFYLDEDFKKEYLEIPSKVRSDEYYVNMMIAWFYATALAKQWDATIGYIENKTLDDWCHNKTIQKAVESYRITDDQKSYLRSKKV